MTLKKAVDDSSNTKILHAAIKEFSIAGFHGARIDAIAKRSGINKAMIYYHFRNKEGLYRAIIEHLFEKMRNLLREHAELDMPPDKKLYRMIESLSVFITDLGDDMRHVLAWEIASGGKTIISVGGKKMRGIIPVVKKMYEDGIREGFFRKDINPMLTHFSMVGSIIFANIMYMTIKDSPILRIIFTGKDIREQFTANLISIL
ncbi:MAG TPA: TetR/AcrR family transcriptional regulator, partial [Spirochaetota bacterium]